MAEGTDQDHAALRQCAVWLDLVPEDIPEDTLQVAQHAVLRPDHEHAHLPPFCWNERTEVVIRQHHTDRESRQDDVLLRTCHTQHGLGVERHRDVKLVLETVVVLN